MTFDTAYNALCSHLRELALLSSTSALLGWDEQTHLPPKGTPYRAEQMALLSKLVHERFTDPRVGQWLVTIEQSAESRDPHSDVGANTREIRRQFDRATKLPTALVEELARHEVLAQSVWVQARENRDFAHFAPSLKRTFELKRQVARCYGFTHHIYDALLDDYEPGETSASIGAVLSGLRDGLIALLEKVRRSNRSPANIAGPFAIEGQEAFGRLAAEKLGFDFSAGRLDVSVHPFCSGMAPGDTRITTRYRTDDFVGALFGVLHETGHALYEQGLPKDQHPGLPLSQSVSLGIHESQSRMWENNVGRSRSFWTYFAPLARQHLPAIKTIDDDDLLFAINQVRPSFIRTESDQVTYNLHILLRYELESAMLAEQLDINDLPDAWNTRTQNYLGISPSDDAQGCLQDIHWSAGLVGYFPTYTLGNLYAAQFHAQARNELGDLDAMFALGDFEPLLGWLRHNIHQCGRRYTAGELVRRVTGRPLQSMPLIAHLEQKVDEFYG